MKSRNSFISLKAPFDEYGDNKLLGFDQNLKQKFEMVFFFSFGSGRRQCDDRKQKNGSYISERIYVLVCSLNVEMVNRVLFQRVWSFTRASNSF